MLGVEHNYSYINSPQTLKYWNKAETLQHESFINRWKYASFKVLVKLKSPLDTEQRHKHKKVSFLIGNLIIETAVCVTFMQSRSRWKHSTEHFQPVWEVISLIRIERFFSVLNVTNAWFIFIVILIAIPFLCIVFNTVRTFRHNKIIDRMQGMLVLWPLSILSSFVMISVVSTLYASLKYGMNSEEENELEFNALLFRSTAICYISVILLGIHFLLVNIANLINTEARHDMIQIVPYAKANIRSDFYKLVGIHGMMVSYYFILEKLAWLHYLLVCIACSFMWVFYYFKHPYYKPMINSLCANQFTVVGFVAFSYFVGEMMGNNAVSFILSVFATPFIVVIADSCMKSKLYRLLHNLHDQIEMIETQDSSELLLRPYLISKSSKVSEIFEQLYKNKQLSNSKLLNVLDSCHTYTFHKDKPLARVKLSLAHNSSASLELDYRYYQCRKLLSKDSSSETLRYLRYCKLLISTQTHDYGLCMQLKNLWSDLSSKDPSGRKVREHIVKIRSLMKMSNLGYSRLIERYPTIPSSYENYGTLLSWIYNEQSSYIGYLHNAKFLKNEYIETSRMDDLSLFHPNTGVMVISCNPKIFGRVVYCNEAVCELLKYSYSNLIGSSFTDLIPEPYRNQHGNLMKSALNTIDSTKISTHSSMLYLLDFFQFILPVKCLMRFDANDNFSCCLITISKCSNNFELALINDYGHIISHSKEFSRYINIKDKALFGHNLYTYIPRLKGTHLNPIRLLNSRKAIHMIHAFAQEFLHTVFVYTHKEDLAEIDLTKVCKYSTKAKLKDNKDLELSDIVEYDESLEESRYFEGSITYADSNSSRYITYREKEEALPFQPIKFVDLPMHFGSTNTTSLKSKSGIFEVRNKSFIISISQKVNYLKIYTGISILLLIAANIAISVIMYNTVLKSIEIGHVDRNLNGVKYSINYLRNSVRELDLSNRLSSSQISHEVTYQEIQASMQILNDTLSDLDTFISEYRLQDFYRQVFLSKSTLIWDQVSTNPTTYKLNFIDTLYTYLQHSQNILNSDPSTLTLLSPDLYFLFQNSFSDSIRSCNSTIEYLNNMEHDFMLNVRLYLIYGLLGIVAAILISGGLITKSLIEVQSSSDKVWSLILSLKSKVLRVLQMNVMYRLNFTHRVDSDKISSLHASDTSNTIRINAYKAWRVITLVLVTFCLINAVFYVCLYTVSLESIIQTIEIRPKMLSYCHHSLIGLLTTYFYAREKIYSDTQHSLFNITSDYILSPNPHQQFEKSLHLFKIISNQHLQMIQQEDLMTSYVYDLYYSSDSLANPYLSLGLAYAHSTFISDLIYLSSIGHSQSSSDLIQEYHNIFQLLRSKHFSLSEEVMNSIEARITDKMNSTVILIVMYSVMLIVVYFVVLLPVIRKIDQVVKSAWTFFNELHLGDIEEDGSNLTRNSN